MISLIRLILSSIHYLSIYRDEHLARLTQLHISGTIFSRSYFLPHEEIFPRAP